MTKIIIFCVCFIFISLSNLARSERDSLIPAEISQINNWFMENVGPLSSRTLSLDPALVRAESSPKIVTVRVDGRGNFKTIIDAISSIPKNNAELIIVFIGSGIYREKITIDEFKPFVTLFGDPKNNPTIVFDGTKAQFNGTQASSTLIVKSNYFVCINMIIKNTTPKPTMLDRGQAVALTITGNKEAFYNCKLSGFQDTLCDDRGNHFYKDCYIEGAVDFIFSWGGPFFLNTQINVLPNQNGTFITEQERELHNGDIGYSFVHCRVTWIERNAYLGKALHKYSTVVFSYTEIGDIVKLEGWFTEPNFDDRHTFYGEYKNTGPGSRLENEETHKKTL